MNIGMSVAMADLITPTAIVFSSGSAPYGESYDASKAIDGNLNTFCALADDTAGGDPVTGRMVFDLGASYSIDGVKLISRKQVGPATYNPKDVEFYISDASGANLGTLATHTFAGICDGASESVAWTATTARYVGMDIDSAYHTISYNYQIGEMQFSTAAVPEPASIVVFATGLIGLLAYAWRKRR
jgi:hypothetical protein